MSAAAAQREPVGVIGTGYVGLVTAAGFAELGSDVYCVDIDADKIARLRAGEVPIYEPGLEELIARNAQRLHFSTELQPALQHARLLFVAVGTPPTYSGDADLSAVHAVVNAMPAGDGHALVMKSTVPCGTGANIKRILREHGKQFSYVSCPEFLKEGSAVEDFLHPDRVVIGDDGDWAGEAVTELYRPLLASPAGSAQNAHGGADREAHGEAGRDAHGGADRGEHGGAGRGELVRTDIASAEMIKLAANAFLATKISFINEIANVCEALDADVVEVARGMGLDKRIGPKFLQAGLGYGGSCFTKDVSALKLLAGNSGYHFQLLNAVIEVNELQKRRVVSKLQRHLGDLAGKRVGLLGLAFKPNTDDMRGASSLVLAARLQAEGVHVLAYDPIAEDEARRLMPQLDYASGALDAVSGADAVVLVTEWPQFVELDWSEVARAMRGTVVIDGRNVLDAGAIVAAGLTYEGIGRGAGA
jgi:UDPglucose 6-dehydrogenase